MSVMPDSDDLNGAPTSTAAAAGRMVGAAVASSKRAARRAREGIRSRPAADRAYRTAVGVTGGATVALGVVLMPLPGPGTLVALGGLAMLGSEFESARKANEKATAAAKAAAAKLAERRARKAARRAASA
ncbi:MAG: PGPGW domain-containing protein [Protaetiibacter sp.]